MPASTRLPLLALLISSVIFPSIGASETCEGRAAPLPGERLQVNDYLVPGKTVVFAFTSAYCPRCPSAPFEKFEEPLAELSASRDDLVVVKVDVNREGATQIDWSSPVAMQFGLKRLPHFIIYGPDGEMIAQDDRGSAEAAATKRVYDMLMELVEIRGESLASHRTD